MDNQTLLDWKRELDSKLEALEKQIWQLDFARKGVKSQIEAIEVLLHPNGRVVNNSTHPTEIDATRDFFSSLESRGWSIASTHKQANIYIGNRMGESLKIWTKFSRYHDRSNSYWFGITPESLDRMINEKGGVIFLLGTANEYVSISFKKLKELLTGATKAKTGQKIIIRKDSKKISFMPVGTNTTKDISQYLGLDGLKGIGIRI